MLLSDVISGFLLSVFRLFTELWLVELFIFRCRFGESLICFIYR